MLMTVMESGYEYFLYVSMINHAHNSNGIKLPSDSHKSIQGIT